MSTTPDSIFRLAETYRDDAVALLRDLIKIPGTSNQEGDRLRFLQGELKRLDACDASFIDPFGNLTWMVGQGPRIVYYDGHTDTVGTGPMEDWRAKGLDPFQGKYEEGWVWGRGAADQLAGVVSQVMATRIIRALGLADRYTVYSIGSVQEEDNDGAGLRWIFTEGIPRGLYKRPDVILLTEGTGDLNDGPLGIYRGHRGRMEIEVETLGRSSHGSNPDIGENAIVMMADVVKEIQALQDRKVLRDDPFLGRGSVTLSRIEDRSASNNCVAPYCRIILDRRLTVGETAETALEEIRGLSSVRALGEKVRVRTLRYASRTWTGAAVENDIYYPSWATPEGSPAVKAAVETYGSLLSPHASVPEYRGLLRERPRVARWIFSTDGVGAPSDVPRIGFAPGLEQHAHTIEERVDAREIVCAAAFLAYYPGVFCSRV